MTISEGDAQTLPNTDDLKRRNGVHDTELYESIIEPGKLLLLVSWRDAAAADVWQPPEQIRQRCVRVIRDYSLADRREAPQFFPDVAPRGGANLVAEGG